MQGSRRESFPNARQNYWKTAVTGGTEVHRSTPKSIISIHNPKKPVGPGVPFIRPPASAHPSTLKNSRLARKARRAEWNFGSRNFCS